MSGQFDLGQLLRKSPRCQSIPITLESSDQTLRDSAMSSQFFQFVTDRLVDRHDNQEQADCNPANPTDLRHAVKPIAEEPEQECEKEQDRANLPELSILGLELISFAIDRFELRAITMECVIGTLQLSHLSDSKAVKPVQAPTLTHGVAFAPATTTFVATRSCRLGRKIVSNNSGKNHAM